MIEKSTSEAVTDFFKIEVIMGKLRNAINKNLLKPEEYEDIVWLIKIVLKSTEFFKTTREVDNLLSNLCGFTHNTKSTGRDRIVDWYFRELEDVDAAKRCQIIKKISKYTFAIIPSDYTEWKNLLLKKRGTK